MNWPSHGSNPQYLYEALNMPAPLEKADFSANINPLGPPPIVKEKWSQLFEAILDYPDPNGYKLKRKLAEREGIQENQLLIGNGGAEIISLIGRMIAGKTAVIIQPAFSEYEAACRVNNCKIKYHQLKPDSWELNVAEVLAKIRNADVLFLCNPSNPTGVFYPKETVVDLIKACRKNNCLLIIDEAFYDFLADYESIVPYIIDSPQLLIIRSMTKMFAIPGLRLGYLMANQQVINQLAAFQPQWSVNALALLAGEWCLESESFMEETRKVIQMERDRLFGFYKNMDFLVSPSAVNFYLLKDPCIKDHLPLLQFLLKRGIIARHTMNFPGLEGEWLRFAIKGSRQNDQLMNAIGEWRRCQQSFL